MKIDHLSASQIGTYLQCGELWRRRYALGEKIPPGIALAVGKSVDASVTANLTEKMAGRDLMTLEAVADTARDSMRTIETNESIWLAPDESTNDVGRAVDKAIRLSRLHAKALAPTIVPTALQRRHEIVVLGVPPTVAITDIEEADGVRDTKTTGKTPQADAADRSDQLTTYFWAKRHVGEPAEKLSLDFLVDLSNPVKVTRETKRNDADIAILMRKIERVTEGIEKEIFLPARADDYRCSPKYCGFHSSCPLVRRPVTVAF